MKNKKLFFCGWLLITSCSVNLYGMNPEICKKIDKVNQQFHQMRRSSFIDDAFIHDCYAWKHDQLATIVLTSGELMTDKEKLQYLIGDSFFEERKKIIIHMIDNKKINPNEIIYQDTNPLKEAALFKDVFFKAYLLEKGAKV